MRASKGNPLVPLAWPKTARSATPTIFRHGFGRRRQNSGEADVALSLATDDALTNPPSSLTPRPYALNNLGFISV